MTVKTVNQRLHAKKRALERYGLDLTDDLYTELNSLAASASVLIRQSNRLTIRRIFFKEFPIRVVYDSHRKQIITFLPLRGAEAYVST
jgi:hypothetical protein